jgi:EAL and modified HD-GYP domain-containing signal transduction protein
MQAFIARQPIFDQHQRVYAYELLFRSGPENACTNPDLDRAAAKVVMDSLLVFGLGNLVGQARAFVNTTRPLLVDEYIAVLPSDVTVVELLETVEPDAAVVAACQKLKRAGYLIALDDFCDGAAMRPLTDLADLIKVDMLATDVEVRGALAKRFTPRGVRLVAEKVETQDGFREARQQGYTYFQGYFFARPAILTRRTVPEFKLNYLRVLREVMRPEVDFRRLEASIRRDVTLSYKLLRYVNSAFFGVRNPVTSILGALQQIGELEIKKWASLIVLASMSSDKPVELVVEAAIRARLCESLAPLGGVGPQAEDLFLMGMFSVIDAILDQPLETALKEISLRDEIKAALLGQPGAPRDLFDCALAYHRGDWGDFIALAGRLGIPETAVPQHYQGALAWAQRAFPVPDSTA